MQAALCLRAPQLSVTLQCQFSQHHHDNSLTLRRTSKFSYGNLRAIVKTQTSSSIPIPPPSHESSSHKKTLASVASAAAITIALASAMGCICPGWSRRGRISLAAPWHNIIITSGGERGRPEPKRDIPRKEQQKPKRQQIAANQVLRQMFERKDLDLPDEFYKITPNYPKIKDYFKHHLRLSDESWETLIKKWKEIQPGQDQIEIGLLLVDICIIKGDVTGANDIDKEIKNAPVDDHRPVIRRAIINMIKDWDIKTEGEKETEWKIFAKEMKDIIRRTPSIGPPKYES